jgi:hypothetical protein
MNANTQYPRGLARVIFETLVELTPEVVASGESWSPEMLAQAERDVRNRLAPGDNARNDLIFDMVFGRSFAEAAYLLLEPSALSRPTQVLRRPPVQAIA